MAHDSRLTVRHFQRREIQLPVELVVAPDHQPQIRFSATSSAADAHVVHGQTIDISRGGLGVMLPLFLPRGSQGTLRVFDPTPVETRPDGVAIYEAAFEHPVIVRRVSLTSPQPTYFLGLSFVDPAPDLETRIAELIDRVTNSDGSVIGSEASHG